MAPEIIGSVLFLAPVAKTLSTNVLSHFYELHMIDPVCSEKQLNQLELFNACSILFMTPVYFGSKHQRLIRALSTAATRHRW